jgi:cytosine/adenosine deaminase-related metal-dependent hydrolase
MPTRLIKNIHTLVTMDADQREIPNGALFIRNHVIEQVGPTADLPASADEVLDLHGEYVVLPGLVNTHHHLYQTLTRVIAPAQDYELFDWLKTLYPIWARMKPEAIQVSTQIGVAELLLSGCTTASDHLYIFPNDCTLDHQIEAVQATGIRFHASRGSMSVGESKGGLPPDSVVEDEDFILKDSQRLIETYHDANRHSMLRITLAPCSPFSVSMELMRASAELARAYPKVRLHTHLAETAPDVAYSLEVFGLRPGDYAEEVGWVGEDVWHAHCVHLSDSAIAKFGQTQTGIAHCPSSNFRLASGIARVRLCLDHHVPVGLGVDGSASNDSSHLLGEVRMAMLAQRAGGNPAALTAREALHLATRGGARVLGRDDIGYLAPGMAADWIGINLNTLAFAGAWHDVVAALVFCTPPNVDYSMIHGRWVVKDGHLVTLDLPPLIARHNRLARALVNGE